MSCQSGADVFFHLLVLTICMCFPKLQWVELSQPPYHVNKKDLTSHEYKKTIHRHCTVHYSFDSLQGPTVWSVVMREVISQDVVSISYSTVPTWSPNIINMRAVLICESTWTLTLSSFVDTSVHTIYWILWALREMGYKNLYAPWIPQRGWFERKWILTKVALRNKKELFFLPLLSFSPIPPLFLPVSLRLWSRKDVDKPLTCPLSLSPSLPPFSLALSFLIPPFPRAVVRHSDRSWWICDGACIPTPEYQAVGRGELCQRKKMTCGTGRHGWIDQSRHSGGGGLERGEGVREPKNWTCPLKSQSE